MCETGATLARSQVSIVPGQFSRHSTVHYPDSLPWCSPFLRARPSGYVLGLAVILLLVLSAMVEPSHAQSIRLSWDPPSQSNLSFQIERGTVPGSYTQVTRVGIGVTTYAVTGLTAGVRYYFVVRSVDAAGVQSGPSNEVSAVAPTTSTPPPGGDGFRQSAPAPAPARRPVRPPPSRWRPSRRCRRRSRRSSPARPSCSRRGTYQLTRSLVITGGLKNVEVRSSTGRASDVILLGPPATTANPRPAAIIVSKMTGITLAGLHDQEHTRVRRLARDGCHLPAAQQAARHR